MCPLAQLQLKDYYTDAPRLCCLKIKKIIKNSAVSLQEESRVLKADM